MMQYADKIQEDKIQAAANSSPKQQNSAAKAFQFVDNRPEAIAKGRLIQMVNNSPHTRQLSTSPMRFNDMPQGKQTTQLKDSYSSNKGVVQAKGIRFDAGKGDYWHVHKDHVKYGNDQSSRIDFAGRTKTKIKKAMDLYHNTLPKGSDQQTTYIECRQWIAKYL